MGVAFKDQVSWLSKVWDSWNEAEKIIAIYNVARKLNPISSRFLQTLLSQNVNDYAGGDFIAAETRANDPAWIGHLAESEGGTAELLHHLPLLRPSNGEAKAHYLTVIPKVLARVLSQSGSHPSSLEKARHLLSYSLIHPALTADERKSLSGWLKVLEERLNQLKLLDSSAHETDDVAEKDISSIVCIESDKGGGPPSPSQFGIIPSTMKMKEDRPCCNSLVGHNSSEDGQIKNHWHDTLPNIVTSDSITNKDEMRWISLEPPQSPNNSGTSSRSSGSESFNEEPHVLSPHPGMRDIGMWLKSLRLHKYSPLLSNLSYKELLSLDEETLEAKGVTKGARHKIVLSIAKLNERDIQLKNIEKDLMNGGNINNALSQMKQIVISPMLPAKISEETTTTILPNEDLAQTSESQSIGTNPPSAKVETATDEELPSRFSRVMGKVCTQLLVSVRPDDEAASTFLSLVEKCLNHEAFTMAHKRRLLSWKQQILRIWQPLPPRIKENRHSRRWSHQYSGDVLNSSTFRSSRFAHQRYSNPTSSQVAGFLAAAAAAGKTLHPHLTPPHGAFYAYTPSISNIMGPRTSLPGGSTINASSLLSPQHFLSKRPSLQEPPLELRPHVTLQRTRSAPSRPHQLPLGGQQPQHQNPPPQPVLSPSEHQGGFHSHPQGSQGLPPPSEKCSKHVSLGKNFGLPAATFGPAQDASAELDITNRLESLCLSMTEHALG